MEPFRRKDRDGWWVRYKNGADKWCTCKGGDTIREAHATLERVERDAMAIRLGWVDHRQLEAAKASRRPISEVVAEYRLYQIGRRNTVKHVDETVRCVKTLLAAIGANCLADINHGRVENWLASLIASGRSARTRNVYRLRINGLLNWAVRCGMILSNPLIGIEHVPERGDRREVSRALTPAEFERLLAATPNADRRLYYRIAARTGLRWGEIWRLNWSNIDLEAGWITPNASNTKSRRADPLPISPDLLDALKLCRRPKVGRVFKSLPRLRTFKRDVDRAGIAYETNRGQVDRKSLRKTFGTHLAIAGVDFRIAVRLMRHTDPRLTMNVYTDPMLLDMEAAVARLGDKLVTKKDEKQAIG